MGTAFSPDYSLRFQKWSLDGSGKCGIFKGSSGVHFAIYELDSKEKAVLDKIEGVGSGYEVELIELPGFGECITYVPARSHVREELAPYDWYHEIVLLGCELHEVPRDYVERIRQEPVSEDPDRKRRSLNRRLIGLLRKENQQ